jgi:hypothetical protein
MHVGFGHLFGARSITEGSCTAGTSCRSIKKDVNDEVAPKTEPGRQPKLKSADRSSVTLGRFW